MRFLRSLAIGLALVWTIVGARAALNKDSQEEEQPTKKDDARFLPHIVMIVVDDLGSHDLGMHGTGIHTPNIDAFVTGPFAEGIYLDEYSVLPYCSPTRAALLSGMYPLRTGVHNVIRPESTAGLPLDVETLPQMLKRAGTTGRAGDDDESQSQSQSQSQSLSYRTHAVGKWHVGHSSWEQTPTFRGFDSFFGFYHGMQDYFTHQFAGGYEMRYDKSPNCGPGCSQVVDERGNYNTHVFTREAIQVVQNHAREYGGGDTGGTTTNTTATTTSTKAPLFLYLAYNAVHCPNEVPPEYEAFYDNRTDWTEQRRNYAGMLTAADEGIGNLTLALQEAGLWENTLLILTTDNGGPTTVGCTTGASNDPKRGGKCSLWEGGTTGDGLLAGPALKRLVGRSTPTSKRKQKQKQSLKDSESKSQSKPQTPQKVTTHRRLNPSRFRHLFHVVDWLPTLAEWVGVIPANYTTMDGVSQAFALGSDAPARTEFFGGYAFMPLGDDWDQGRWWGPSLRHLNWKIVQGPSAGPDATDPLPDGSPHIAPPGENGTGKFLLFDLDSDPTEETDVSEYYPEILESMIYKLKLYKESFVYPQANDGSDCPFPGFVNTTDIGPTWFPWCNSN